MEINKIVYMCKDNHSLLDEMLRNKEITIADYQKAKMILDDEELCQMSCVKYEQSLTAADKLTSTIKSFDTGSAKGSAKEVLSSDKVKKFKPLAIIVVIALIAAGGFSFYKTFINKVTIDVGDNIVVKLDKEKYSGTATDANFHIYTNFDYYNESGFYDDMKTELKGKGLSQKEIDGLVPTYDQKVYDAYENMYFRPEFSKTSNIENGDEITINFTYDKDYAKQNRIKVKNSSTTIKVSGLKQYVTEKNYKTADSTNLDSACEKYLSRNAIESYIKENSDQDDNTSINKLGTCGYYVDKDYDTGFADGQEATLLVEGNVSNQYSDSIDVSFYIDGAIWIKDGKYKFDPVDSYGDSTITYSEGNYEDNFNENYVYIVKKWEKVDMDSDN